MKSKQQHILYKLLFTLSITISALSVNAQSVEKEEINWERGCDSTFVFEINDKEAQKFLKSEDPEKLMPKILHSHVATFKDKWTGAPKQGHFIYARINTNKINYNYIPEIPFQVFLFHEYGILTLQVIDDKGEIRSDASIKIQGGKWRLFDSQIPYDKESKVYRVDDWSDNPSRILTVKLDKFTAVFDLAKEVVRPSYDSYYRGSSGNSSPDFISYMITDKNKYKPGEKVRFKSYALTGNKKPIKKPLELWIQEPDSYHNFRKIKTISPYNSGGFADEIEIHDSLKLRLDNSYAIQLRDQKGKIVARSSFKYEDYELYENRLETKLKDFTQYFPNENELEIKVIDINNLIMPDMKAQITISRGEINKSYVDLLVVPSIIKADTIKLDNDNSTTYKIPSTLFDKTDCTYFITVNVLTPDGQALRASHHVNFYKSKYDINYTTKDSTVIFNFMDLGIEKNTAATLSIDGKDPIKIVLPHTERFNQNIGTYSISIPEYGIERNIYVANIDDELDVEGGLNKDSLVLELVNPLSLHVTWYIYQGNTLLEKGSGKEIDFKKPYIDLDISYFLEVFYTQGGEDKVYRRLYAPKKEFLNIDWNMPTRIYPGQTLDSKIKVTDSRGNGVKGVDITAFASNALLNYTVDDLPYYGKAPKGRERRDSYDIDNKRAQHVDILTQSNYDFWNKIAHIENAPFYQFTFPDPRVHNEIIDTLSLASGTIPYHDIFKYSVDTPDGTTEFAPFVMSNGFAQDIYTIEVDNNPVYFSWTQQPQGYSFLVDSENYHTIRLRLFNRVIIIDKVCFVKGKKTILSLNLNNMPKSAYVRTVEFNAYNKGTTKKPIWQYEFTESEKEKYLEKISVVPIIDDRYTYFTRTYLDNKAIIPISHPIFRVKGNDWELKNLPLANEKYCIIGPLSNGKYQYMDGVEYDHEGGFAYRYSKNVVYKYPTNPFPTLLRRTESNLFSQLNDFHFTAKEFDRQIGFVPPSGKWFPEVINLPNTKIHVPKDSLQSGLFGIVMRNRKTDKLFFPAFQGQILTGRYTGLYGIRDMESGNYDVFAVYESGKYLRCNDIPLGNNTYIELKMNNYIEHPKDSISTKILSYKPSDVYPSLNNYNNNRNRESQNYKNIGKSYFNASNDVRGRVVDETGEPLIGVTIQIKGTTNGTVCDIDGEFILDLHGAENTLIFSYIGFVTQEVKATRGSSLNIVLKEETMLLDEIVVMAYGIQRKRNITSAMVYVSSSDMQMPNIEMEDLDEYSSGEKGEDNGSAKLYSELLLLDGMRSNFSDIGFWEPKLVTDRKGEVQFPITFPDNITKWQAIVYAMNKKLQTGTLRRSINSYKPLMAEIKAPQFLVESDSSLFSTNIRNYTKDKEISGKITFVNNGDSIFQTPIQFAASYQKYIPVVAPVEQDSLTFSYRFTRNDGYSDGEQRGIPIEKQGVEIAKGSLQFLRNGDEISVAASNGEQIQVSITGKPIDIYMNAAYDLVGYKYACNEQLASKLIGLLNYKLYDQYKGQTFKHDKKVNEIIGLLLKNQNGNKLWSWWSNNNNTTYWMSAHILRALNMAKKAGYDVNLDISKVKYDYVDIHSFRKTSLHDIDVLNALLDWGTEQNYEEAIELFENKIKTIEAHEDSLVSIYKKTKNSKEYARRNSYLTYKLSLIEMRQKLGLPYDKSLITNNINRDVLGAVNIKDTLQSNYWYYNNDAANVIAYRIVRNDTELRHYVDNMQMYILSTKRYGWNTYQASSALMTVLPDLLNVGATEDNLATVSVRGKENKSITTFPYYATLQNKEQLSFKKESGVPLIYSAYTIENRTKKQSGEAFEITTWINQQALTKGVSVELRVEVTVKQDNAEHVMIEVPIPAGCSYENKNRSDTSYEDYREYFKEKTVIFCSRLEKGKHTFYIELMPRYSGSYILNPAKVEMMYFPVINANNDIDRIEIK